MFPLLKEKSSLKKLTLLKKRLCHRCLPVNYCEFWEISINTFSYRTPLVASYVFSNISITRLYIAMTQKSFDTFMRFPEIKPVN